MNPLLSWRCRCGRVFFEVTRRPVTERYSRKRCLFYGTCPTCGRAVRRCFILKSLEYRFARSMLSVTTTSKMHTKVVRRLPPQTRHPEYAWMEWMLRVAMEKAAAVADGQFDKRRTRRMRRLLIRKNGTLRIRPMWRYFQSRIGVMHVSTVGKIKKRIEPVSHVLADAPPWMEPKVLMRQVHRYRSIGDMVPACEFCNVPACDRRGQPCIMVKVQKRRFRYVQVGMNEDWP